VRRRWAGILGAAFALAACGVANSTGGDDVGHDAAPVDATTNAGDVSEEDGGGVGTGVSADSSGGADSGAAGDSGAVADSNADAGVSEDSGANDGATASDVAAVSDGSVPISDAGGNDGGEPDAAATDGGGGGQMDGTTALDAAGSDAACSPVTGTSFHCYGGPLCASASQYCAYGAVPNACDAIPSACLCAETAGCACLLANSVPLCDSGTLVCTETDAGALFVAKSACAH